MIGSPGQYLRTAQAQQLRYNINRAPHARPLLVGDFLPSGFAAEVASHTRAQTDEEFEEVLDAMVAAGE